MSSSRVRLQEQLKDTGIRLLDPPPSTEELLNLLDRIESLLANVEQSPSTSTKEALLPTMKALISNELLRHSDLDVKFSVVSCISEITRISAPDAPYNDDFMKEIFQLTVAAFEKLSLESGRCYTKARNILDVVARVRSSLMMLDLECNELVFEMFQHFLNHIRSDHPPAVFSAMEAIMTVVLDESEDIPFDLLSLLLSSVKRENQKISPVSAKLGENVITICASTLEPYLKEAVRSMGIDINDYAQIVASIYQNETDSELEPVTDSGDNLENENRLVEVIGSDKSSQETKGLAPDAVSHEKADQEADGISRSLSKCTAPTRNDNGVVEKNPSENLRSDCLTKHPRTADSIDIAEPSSSLSLKTDKSKTEPDSNCKKRSQKPSSLVNIEEGHSKGADSIGTAEPNSSLSIKAEKPESAPDSVPKKRGQKQNSLKNPPGGGHPRRAESRVTAGPKSSLSIKVDTTKSDPDTASKKRGRKSSSLVDSQKALLKRANSRGVVVPDSSTSIKAEKSESEPDSVPKKRGRKPNSLMNPEEGYDNFWVSDGKKGPSHCRNSQGKTIDSLPSRNSVSKKGTSSTLDNVTESAVSQRRRQKRKGSTLNQEDDTKSPLMVKAEVVSSQVEEKTLKCVDLNLKIEPEDTSLMEEKELGNPTKLGLAAKENEETAVASGRVVANKETEVSIHPEEKLQQLSTVKSQPANVTDRSSVPRATKKRRVSNSSNNDTDEESGLKNVSSGTGVKTSNGDEHYSGRNTKTMFKRKHIIGKEEASEIPDFGELLVGRRIKVWWPMDKMFYEGVIASYDPVKKKHQVTYLDGDIETLNLQRQRWELIQHDASTDEGKNTDLPGPDASPDINSPKEKQTAQLEQEKEAKGSIQVKQEKADSPSKSNPQKGAQRTRSKGKQAKKSYQAKVDSSSERNPQRRVQKTNAKSDREKKAKKSDQAKADPSSESNPQKRKRKASFKQENQAKKSDQAKPDCSMESNPRKRRRKTSSDQETQGKKSNKVKQSKAGSYPLVIAIPARVFNIKRMNETKSADAPPFDNPVIKDEPMDGTTRTDEGVKDDDQISAGNIEADKSMSTSDSRQIIPETMSLFNGKSPEADIANRVMETSKDVKSEKTMET